MWEAVVAVLAFVGGMLLMDRKRKRDQVRDQVAVIDAQAEERIDGAKLRLEARLADAKADAAASVADRPSTDDPLADLRDRLDR